MKKRLLCPLLALAIGFPVTFAPHAHGQEPGRKPEETELRRVMEKFNATWRKLRRQAANPASNEDSLELVAILKAGGEKALTLEPVWVEGVIAVDRGKFVQDYQKKMEDFLVQVGKLEQALKTGDNAAAQEIVLKIGRLQKEAHREFKRPDR